MLKLLQLEKLHEGLLHASTPLNPLEQPLRGVRAPRQESVTLGEAEPLSPLPSPGASRATPRSARHVGLGARRAGSLGRRRGAGNDRGLARGGARPHRALPVPARASASCAHRRLRAWSDRPLSILAFFVAAHSSSSPLLQRPDSWYLGCRRRIATIRSFTRASLGRLKRSKRARAPARYEARRKAEMLHRAGCTR